MIQVCHRRISKEHLSLCGVLNLALKAVSALPRSGGRWLGSDLLEEGLVVMDPAVLDCLPVLVEYPAGCRGAVRRDTGTGRGACRDVGLLGRWEPRD